MSVTTIDCHYLGYEGYAAAFLIEEGDRAAFVETNTATALPRLLAALDAKGLTPEQVEYVIITHVHLDHAGGASALMDACPNATLLAHPRAAPHAIDPTRLVASAQKVYGEETFRALYGTIGAIDASRVRALGDGETVALGSRTLSFLHTRGHANHHFCVLDSGSNAIFTGDALGLVYPGLQGEGLFAIPSTSPTDFDADAARESIARIVASGAERAYLTHFGACDSLEAVAEQLDTQLAEYGAIVDDADASGLDGEALDAFCRERVDGIFGRLLGGHGFADGAAVRELLATDVELNGQGAAAAVRKRRFKASQRS